MSGLKEEWASIVKLRESVSSDSSKKEQIRSRIFNNFYSGHKQNTKELPEINEIPSKKEKVTESPVHPGHFVIFDRKQTPEPQKKFEFGLKGHPQPSPNKISETVRTKKIDEFWKIEDFPQKMLHEDIVPDKYEVLSLADYNSSAKNIKSQKKDICVFSSMSPITRFMCNMTIEEEEQFIKESKKHEKHMHGYIHLLHQDVNFQVFDKIDWAVSSNFCMGFVFKSDINSWLNPPAEDPFSIDISKEHSGILQVPHEHSLVKHANLQRNSKLFINTVIEEPSTLEKEMIEMMDMIKYSKSENIDEKLNRLLEIVDKRIKSNKDMASNMQIRVLYQFLIEYKKAKDLKKSRNADARASGEKVKQKKSMDQTKKAKDSGKTDGKNIIKQQEKPKGWIGGSKHIEELEDNNWMSASKEKTKKITRNEMLYNKATKETDLQN